jgi:hypothetical protein
MSMYLESLTEKLNHQATPWSKVPVCEADNCSADPEIPCQLWNPKTRYRVRMEPVTGCYPVHVASSYKAHPIYTVYN